MEAFIKAAGRSKEHFLKSQHRTRVKKFWINRHWTEIGFILNLHKIGNNMAQFKKGEGGRKKGSPNKVTLIQRDYIQCLLDSQQDKIFIELSKLTGKDYISAITGMMEFVLPKLQRTELKGADDNYSLPVIVGMIVT